MSYYCPNCRKSISSGDYHCRHCGEKVSKGGGGGICFMVTAVFGTPLAEEVEALSQLRDKYLLTNKLGQKFVAFYYRHSPVLAEFISDNEEAKTLVRIALWPLIKVAELIS